ncbi:MAG: M20/M25/M40 family metallo-hydrolase [Caldilineaceae bacterium]|nr:M20/M25/M40 family metallo-hydrolase [Caldilineaceae bacterium]
MTREFTPTTTIDQTRAAVLLQGLVAIPSLSRQEEAASRWLVEQMHELGYARAYVDEAGSAVGELGASDAPQVLMLLGHIDTVPGDIPVRVEETAAGPALYGRGSVDAKGPLATFVAAAARVGDAWARAHNVRVVVVGAVEEESATSKGARTIRDRFDGVKNPVPAACVIGEPSGWSRVTLGYKGRLLVEITAAQPMMHTAGPDAGVATVAVDLWNWVAAYADHYNVDRPRTFDQLMPSLRRMQTATTLSMDDTVEAQIGIRLPPAFDVVQLASALVTWLNGRVGGKAELPTAIPEGAGLDVHVAGVPATVDLHLRGYEQTWRSERDPLLVRSFLAAIRTIAPDEKAGFVVKTGTSDMNVVAPVWGCPIVAYGPGDSSLDHTPNEHLHLHEYWQAVLVLEQTLRNLGAMLHSE